MNTPMIVGREWLIEAAGCEPSALRDQKTLQTIFSEIITDIGLKTVGGGIWHKFPGEGGITGLEALTESHLACHTYPEHGLATFNLYCCKDRPEWNWKSRLAALLGASSVKVTKITRGNESAVEPPHTAENKDLQFEIEMSVAGGDA